MDVEGTIRDGAATTDAGAVDELETSAGRVTLRTTHPGGNGRVVGVDGDTIRLESEPRDSSRRWFYWNVDVESDVTQTLRLEFPNDEAVGPRGPAVRMAMPCGGPIGNGAWDEWRWLGADHRIDATGFRYAFDAGEGAQFALSFPYQRADFDAFAFEFESDPRLTVETLTTTAGGRTVPVVRLGPSDADCHIALAARHHACESTASYVLEGTLRELLESEDAGALLETHRVHAYPFGDLDGVERGDQGKHRSPHDHNRDYVDGNAITDLSPLYPTTAAIAADLRSRDPLAVALDFHCPYKWGGDINDRPFFVTDPSAASAELRGLATRLEDVTQTRSRADEPTLTFDSSPGIGLASFDGQSGLLYTFERYCSQLGAEPAASLEVPYVGTATDPVTPTTARQFGRDLAVALADWTTVNGR
ncbi:M14 family zinc carboxypeptidase [Natrinema caseinilyticum]|uniref:M14 family zinc carboxypeptidase n=1 Tax=Natrinema caseinilyticum TaxID=2961570 RepID=UPI0020C53FDA|nr:M14 family zinc carboxypeptidase [Natrinema caseinilyticum]